MTERDRKIRDAERLVLNTLAKRGFTNPDSNVVRSAAEKIVKAVPTERSKKELEQA